MLDGDDGGCERWLQWLEVGMMRACVLTGWLDGCFGMDERLLLVVLLVIWWFWLGSG